MPAGAEPARHPDRARARSGAGPGRLVGHGRLMALGLLVNVPIGLAALAFGVVFLADQRLDHAGTFGLPGFLLSGAGLGLLMYGVSEDPNTGWGTCRSWRAARPGWSRARRWSPWSCAGGGRPR